MRSTPLLFQSGADCHMKGIKNTEMYARKAFYRLSHYSLQTRTVPSAIRPSSW